MTPRKARKEHKCTYCDKIIKRDNLYFPIEFKAPRYTDVHPLDPYQRDEQIGIIYVREKMCMACNKEYCNSGREN